MQFCCEVTSFIRRWVALRIEMGENDDTFVKNKDQHEKNSILMNTRKTNQIREGLMLLL